MIGQSNVEKLHLTKTRLRFRPSFEHELERPIFDTPINVFGVFITTSRRTEIAGAVTLLICSFVTVTALILHTPQPLSHCSETWHRDWVLRRLVEQGSDAAGTPVQLERVP